MSDFNEEMGALDREVGLSYCGDEELYEEVLKDFYLLIDTKAEKIESLRSSGNIKDYVIEVHALKSTARMIGATKLSEQALELEMAGKADDVALVNEKTAHLLEMYKAYKKTLAYFDSDNDNVVKDAASNSDIQRTLSMMLDAANDFDMDGVDNMMEKINSMQMPNDSLEEMAKKLNLLVRDVAFDEIKELCIKMSNAL